MALIAKEPIRHNGKQFKKGEPIEGLSKKDEARLLELSVAEKAVVITPSKGNDKEKIKDDGKGKANTNENGEGSQNSEGGQGASGNNAGE